MNVQVFIWSEMQLVTRHLQVMVILGYTANILRHILVDLQFYLFLKVSFKLEIDNFSEARIWDQLNNLEMFFLSVSRIEVEFD